jgi:gas vesicle protein
MNTTAKVILGITVAAAAGAAIGMLIAPEKGTDLQRKIKEGATDLVNEFSSLLGTGKDLVSEFKAKVRPALKEMDVMRDELGV